MERQVDTRLRERMNRGDEILRQSPEGFLGDWGRTTRECDFRQAAGNSSRDARARFAAPLEELNPKFAGRHVLLVSHGGITVDLLRNLFEDGQIRRFKLRAIEFGIPNCGLAHLRRDGERYELIGLAEAGHLAAL